MSTNKQCLDRRKNNWPLWHESMMNLFVMNEIKGYIEGKIPCPDKALDPEGAKNWKCNNIFMKQLINENLAETEHSHTQGCVTATEMWISLKVIYKCDDGLVFTDQLQTLFQIRALEGSNILEHLRKLKKQWDQLSPFHDTFMDNLFFKHIIA